MQVLGGHVAQLMPAYSALWTPAAPTCAPDCANSYILRDVLRQRFGAANISVISDNGGIAMVYQVRLEVLQVAILCFRYLNEEKTLWGGGCLFCNASPQSSFGNGTKTDCTQSSWAPVCCSLPSRYFPLSFLC